ncbi:EAL domain-containing protein, partial [Escherichia coli]|nr:EAL domain-containing protein [Escherichia coli]
KKMNIKTVAEGVQTQEQANTLILLGVDYLQGYYFGRPRKIADLLQEEQNELFCAP